MPAPSFFRKVRLRPGCGWKLFAAAFVMGIAGCCPCSQSAIVPERTGAELVAAACQSCHLPVAPELLDRRTWTNETLRYMAPWLGVSRPNYERMPDGEILRAARIHPDEPVVTAGEWRELHRYFAEHAPASPPPQPPRIEVKNGLAGFRAERWALSEQPGFVTLLRIDTARSRVLVGDGQDKSLRSVDPQGKTQWRIPVPSAPVSVTSTTNELLVTLIGRVFPSDEPVGQVWAIADDPGRHIRRVLRGLRRPVHSTVMDLDGDGHRDLVVSAFGNRLGNLSWYRGLGDGRYQERLLDESPGNLCTHPLDWNSDGRVDLLLLRAQAREALEVLLAEPGGTWDRRTLLSQPPTFGYAAMELADLDGDGRDEILLVNGDSGDYASPPRAFHGLRVYQRTDDGGVRERFHFPMFGAYGVKSEDFDGDRRRDIALISFFPDYHARPAETLVVLRNLGDFRFEASSLEEPASLEGRWLVLDAGDLDGDGDNDIVVGSFFRGPPTTLIPDDLVKRWETNGVDVLVLRNTLR